MNNLPYVVEKWPLSKGARSLRRKKILDEWEEADPGIMRQVHTIFTKKFIPMLGNRDLNLNTCKICGGPAFGEICSRCKIELEIKKRGVEFDVK